MKFPGRSAFISVVCLLQPLFRQLNMWWASLHVTQYSSRLSTSQVCSFKPITVCYCCWRLVFSNTVPISKIILLLFWVNKSFRSRSISCIPHQSLWLNHFFLSFVRTTAGIHADLISNLLPVLLFIIPYGRWFQLARQSANFRLIYFNKMFCHWCVYYIVSCPAEVCQVTCLRFN